MEVSASVSMPHPLPLEKSSSKRTLPVLMGIEVSVGKGIFAVTVGEGTTVAPKDRPSQLEARKIPPPPTANKRHAPIRQPTAQPADLPDLGTVWVTGPRAGGRE